MKRLAITCFSLAILCVPTAMVLGQDEKPEREGERPRETAPERERSVEGRGRGEGGFLSGEGLRRGEGQGRGEASPRGGGAMMARLPIIMALDSNQDGEISAEEIDLAIVALKKLDKNKDGKLTMDELAPNFGGMPGLGQGGIGPGAMGPGGPGGFGMPAGNPEEMANRMMESDKDNDGYLSESELPERMRPMFDRVDSNSDKKISREEIMAMFQARGRGPGQGVLGAGVPGQGVPGRGAPAGREGDAERREGKSEEKPESKPEGRGRPDNNRG